ncbi:MAG: hypothetical protein NVS3B7_12970 [Candidatus Elarobacter sp.]
MNDACDAESGTVKDTIVLPDGRYVIYYTFSDGVDDRTDAESGRP